MLWLICPLADHLLDRRSMREEPVMQRLMAAEFLEFASSNPATPASHSKIWRMFFLHARNARQLRVFVMRSESPYS